MHLRNMHLRSGESTFYSQYTSALHLELPLSECQELHQRAVYVEHHREPLIEAADNAAELTKVHV